MFEYNLPMSKFKINFLHQIKMAKKNIVLINFADSLYADIRKINTETAIKYGKVAKVIEYSLEDIDREFYQKHIAILSQPRGAGLWLWKPYFILKTLAQLNDGDYLMYCDAGSFFINKVDYLINRLEKSNQDIMGFESSQMEKHYTKNEVFVLLNYKDKNLKQILSGVSIYKKSTVSIKFVKEWLKYACDERLISNKRFLFNIPENEDFVSHREDQAIFSILYHKNNLEPFRVPFHFAVTEWEEGKEKYYKTYANRDCNYPVILMHTRNMDYKEFVQKNKLWIFLYKNRIYNKYTFFMYKMLKNVIALVKHDRKK